MLSEKRKNFRDCTNADTLRIADHLCHGGAEVRPIFECVKVFAKVHSSGKFTYARHPYDLGTDVTSASDISSRMKDPARASAVLEALGLVESNFAECWPFAPGTSSWVLLEVLHPSIRINGPTNKPTIIFRKAVRLSARGVQTSTELLERLFKGMQLHEAPAGWSAVIDPTILLTNTSGSGIFTKLREQFEGMLYLTEGADLSGFSGLSSAAKETLQLFSDELLESNFALSLEDNPGFYFSFEGTTYQIRSSAYSPIKKKDPVQRPPLPIVGMIR